MKLVLSRKGIDSSYGGVPSALLRDGRLLSFPIPSAHGRPLTDVRYDGGPLASIVGSLTRGRIGSGTSAHLDPDLDARAVPRQRGWRSAFGQIAAAQRHLARHGVGTGDLFLFFGWFREVEPCGQGWRYSARCSGGHGLFGWLQVAEVIAVDAAPKVPTWCATIRTSCDLSADRVLVTTRFWYFGSLSPLVPAALRHLLHRKQGHSVNAGRQEGDLDCLREWLSGWPAGVHGAPVDCGDAFAGTGEEEPRSGLVKRRFNEALHQRPSSVPSRPHCD